MRTAEEGRGMPMLRAGETHLEYFEAGAGDRVVVLVHGAASSARIWETVQRCLAEAGVRSIAISTRGAGASDRPEDPRAYTPAEYARDLAAAVEALGLERFTLVGHSLGTIVSRYYVRDHAERVRALVLIAGPDPGRAAPSPEEQARRAARPTAATGDEPPEAWTRQHAGLSAATRETLWRDIRSNPPQRAAGQASPWPGLEALAAEMPVPTLVVCGDADDVVPPATALRGYLELPEGRRSLHVFHGVGHYPPAQVPDRLAGVIVRFMDGAGA
jgi:3-oxoadipate enol-lactonase